MRGCIFFTERNIRGAWVIYGMAGIRQYYGYTKKQAEAMYREECARTVFMEE